MGRAKSGKTTRIREYIKNDIKKNKEAILIVPEQYTLQSEQDYLKYTDSKGIVNLGVLSFTSLSDTLRNKYKGKRRSLIDETGIYILTAKIAEESKSELDVFKRSYRKKGFIERVSGIVQSLKKNCIEPEDIKEFLSKEESHEILEKKLKDINIIYEKMNKYMDKKYMDHNDMMSLLKENIEITDFFEKKNVYIDGFDVFSGREYEVIKAIAKKADNIVITLNFWDDKFQRDYSLFSPVELTYRKLDNLSLEITGKNLEIERLKTNNIEDIYLNHLEKELFSYPSNSLKGVPESISINSYLNLNQEVEGVAKKIIDLVREEKIYWRDILVVSNDMEMYQSAIKRIFSEYEIPYFLDERRDIVSHNLMVYLIELLKTIDRGFKYEDLFKFLKTDLSNLSLNEVDKLENYSLKYKIEGEKYFKPFEINDEKDEITEEIRKKLIEGMKPLIDNLKRKDKIKKININLYNFLKQSEIDKKIFDLMQDQIEENNIDLANETAQIWNILVDILNQMSEIMGDSEVSLEEYINILQAGLSNYKAGIIPPTLDQVIFGSLDRTKAGDIKYLFILGANDGILPKTLEDEGILLDDDRDLMKKNGLDLNMDVNMMLESENFKIYSSFTKPRKGLNISFALSSQNGSSLRPSTIIDRIKYIFPDIKILSHIDLEQKNRLKNVVSIKPSIKYLVESLRDYLEYNDIEKEWFNIFYWYMKSNYKEKLINIIDGLFFMNKQEYIDERLAKKLYSSPLRASVSRIEKFNSCPFSHFMTYGIIPKERKKCIVDYPDIGNILHETLEKFGENLNLNNISWRDLKEEEIYKIVENILNENLKNKDKYVFKSSARNRYLINKLRRVSLKSIKKAAEQIEIGEFVPIAYELKFKDKIPAIEIQFEDGTLLQLEGVIDRLDIYNEEGITYFRVIDYKSGNKNFDISKALQGLEIQLLVYLDAIMKNNKTNSIFEKTELYPAGAFYFKLKDPISQGEDLDEAEKNKKKEEKISGIMVNEEKIIELMDRDIKENKDSSIYKLKLNNDNSVRKHKDIIKKEDLDILIKYIEKIIKESGEEIKKGNVKIEPFLDTDGKTTPCSYCEYSSICKFDINFEGNKYRKLKKMDIENIKENEESDINA